MSKKKKKKKEVKRTAMEFTDDEVAFTVNLLTQAWGSLAEQDPQTVPFSMRRLLLSMESKFRTEAVKRGLHRTVQVPANDGGVGGAPPKVADGRENDGRVTEQASV